MKNYSFFLFLILLLSLGCRKNDSLFKSTDAQLSFSLDTVYFDTVFTKLPGSNYPRSVTKNFIIRNPYKENIQTTIELGNGVNSPYRINIDGVAGNQFSNIIIPARDSIIGFVEVTLEANNNLNPSIVYDSIRFTTNGNVQHVILAAYGWDAHYYKDSIFQTDEIWNDLVKPYVIVNSILVPQNTKLNILPGVQIYSSPESFIYIDGTLEADGDFQNKIVFQGDRLTPSFKETPGQWGGIHLLKNSINNKIKNCIIKNSVLGVRIDSLSNNSNPKLEIKNTLIKNCSLYGILGITGSLDMENIAISRCGSYGMIAFWGGNYSIKHSSIGSGYLGGRSQAAMVLNNIARDENDNFVESFPMAYTITNSIIWGPLEDELLLDIDSNKLVSSNFENCIIRTKGLVNKVNNNNNLINFDPLFEDPRNGNLKIRENSPAKSKAKQLNPPIVNDIDGNSRNQASSIGAYE